MVSDKIPLSHIFVDGKEFVIFASVAPIFVTLWGSLALGFSFNDSSNFWKWGKKFVD